MDEPLITVGIPTYNRPDGLRRTLEGILNQSYRNIKVIVSDNCSSDPGVEQVISEIARADSRVDSVRQPKNIGLFHNFIAVLKLAEGQFFAWAADDDERSPDYFERCIFGFQKSHRLVLTNSYSQQLDFSKTDVAKIDQGCTTIGLKPNQRYQQYLSSIFTTQAGIGDLIYGVIKLNALRRIMPIPNILSWDHLLLAALALQGEFYTIPENLMYSRPGGLSSKSPGDIAKAQMIQGSLSETMPWLMREYHLQAVIRASKYLSLSEKLALSTWSYQHYLFKIAPTQVLDLLRKSPMGKAKRYLEEVSKQ